MCGLLVFLALVFGRDPVVQCEIFYILLFLYTKWPVINH
jgi:hypothetical protein